MGNNQGAAVAHQARQSYGKMYDSFSYAPVTTHRTEATYSARFQGENSLNPNAIGQPAPLLKTAYYGKWRMRLLEDLGPEARIGQCNVFDPVNDTLIIAYGHGRDSGYLNDAWVLHLKPMRWSLLQKSLLSPRSYPSSVLVGRKMFIFGGAYENQFFDDLHYIDLDTGNVVIVEIQGNTKPCPRTCPAFFHYDNYLFLWGGFDGRAHGGVYRFDLSRNSWFRYEKSYTGLAAPAYCCHDGKYYVFGGVKGTPLSVFDPKTGDFQPFPCVGTEPHMSLTHASLISVDEYMFLVGGEDSTAFMHIFALDVKRSWWFAFHVRPDNETLTLADGIVNKVGLFMLPREHSSSVIYSTKERELVSVMGSKMSDQAPVFSVTLGESLSCIHLRNDMLELYHYDQKDQ